MFQLYADFLIPLLMTYEKKRHMMAYYMFFVRRVSAAGSALLSQRFPPAANNSRPTFPLQLKAPYFIRESRIDNSWFPSIHHIVLSPHTRGALLYGNSYNALGSVNFLAFITSRRHPKYKSQAFNSGDQGGLKACIELLAVYSAPQPCRAFLKRFFSLTI
jgi:hypothetical protein